MTLMGTFMEIKLCVLLLSLIIMHISLGAKDQCFFISIGAQCKFYIAYFNDHNGGGCWFRAAYLVNIMIDAC
jgi:hypothetical protein